MTTANGGGAGANGHNGHTTANGSNGHGGLDRDAFLSGRSRMTFNRSEMEGLVANALSMRRDWLTRMGDPRRDIAAECGYPANVRSVSAWEYQDLYDKDPIAKRVVDVMPKECWQVQPLVYESDDPEVVTPFEQAWDELGKSLRGEKSWYKDEEGSPVWDYLLRADILSGVGHFGIILVGIDDGLPLDVPAEGVMSDDAAERPVDAPPKPGNPAMASTPVVPEKQETGVPERKTEGPGAGANGQQASVASTPPDKAPVKPSAEPLPPIKPAGTAAVPPKDPDPYRNPSGLFAGTDAQYRGGWSPPDPAAPTKSGGKRKLLYLRVFPESLVEIVQFESNFQSPRFGQPVMYNITMNDPRAGQHSGIGLPLATMRVHWTRVIHVVDGVATSEVFGVPRMRPVLLRLRDLEKVYGGDAEAFWKNCFSGDTRFFDGHVLRELRDCVGEEVTVISADGQQRKATVKAFGERPLVTVVLKPKDGRNTNFRRSFRATPDHRWVLEGGTVTENLKPGDVLAANHFPEFDVPEDPAGFAHGFVFGDGNMKTGRSHYFTLRLCGKKRRWFDALKRTAHVANESVASMDGDPHLIFVSREVNLKALPQTDLHTEAYLRSFLEGWAAADGHDVNGISKGISTQNQEAVDWLFANGPRHGFEITGHTTTDKPTQYGPRSAPLHTICYRRERQGYRVTSIVDEGDVEETFCVVEPETGTFTLEGGVVTGNCLMKLLFETHPQLGGEVDVDLSAMRDMMENFGNGLQGWMYLSGMSGKSVAPSVVDPTAHINIQIEAICVEKEVPIRVFKGSERGELASSQDDAAWNDRLKNRQRTHITPRLIIPFVDRLIAMKVLPEPKGAPPKPAPGIDPVTGKPLAGQAQVGPDGKPLTGPDGKPITGPGGKPAAPGRPSPFGPRGPQPKPGMVAEEGGPPSDQPTPKKKPAFLGNAPPPPFGRKPGAGGPPQGPPSSPVSRGQGRPPLPSPQEDAGAAVDDIGETDELGGGLDDPRKSLGQAVAEEKGYRVEWPDLTSQTAGEKAAVLGQKTAAYAQYVSGGLEAVIPPLTYMTQFDDFTEEEAQAILESAEADAAMAEQEDMAKQAQMIEQGLVPDPTDPEQVAAHNPAPIVGGPPGAGGPPKAGPPKPGGGFPPKGGPPSPGGKPPGGKPPQFNSQGPAWNAFCPTGEGGGVDPSCSPGGGSQGSTPRFGSKIRAVLDEARDQGFTVKTEGTTTYVTKVQRINKTTSKKVGMVLYEDGTAFDISVDAEAAKGIRSADGMRELLKQVRVSNAWTPVAPANFAGNAFCPTGPGGGQDNSCSSKGGGDTGDSDIDTRLAATADVRMELEDSFQDVKETAEKFIAISRAGDIARAVMEDSDAVTLGQVADQNFRQVYKPVKDLVDRADMHVKQGEFREAAVLHLEAYSILRDANQFNARDIRQSDDSVRVETARKEWLEASRAQAMRHKKLAGELHDEFKNRRVRNAFCPTGEGGGIDPTCGGKGGPSPGGGPPEGARSPVKAPDTKALELADKVPLTGAASPTSVQVAEVGGKKWAIKLKDGSEEDNRHRAEVEQEVTSLAAEAGVKVAQTFAMRVGFSEAAVSEYVSGQSMHQLTQAGGLGNALSKLPKEDIDRQILFDYAVGFSDGHLGNYMIADGSLVGIDKEFSLGLDNGGSPGAYWSRPQFTDYFKDEDGWRVRSLDPNEVASMAAKAGKMAESLRSRGKMAEYEYVNRRAEVLRKLSSQAAPTLGSLERLSELEDKGRRGGSIFERTKGLLDQFKR